MVRCNITRYHCLKTMVQCNITLKDRLEDFEKEKLLEMMQVVGIVRDREILNRKKEGENER